MNEPRLARLYRELLLDGIVPFWEKHVDEENGGVFTCIGEDGSPVSDEKYVWSQARWVWVCAALYNRIEKQPKFLKWARRTIDFLLAHCRDREGRWVYRITREGHVLEGAVSIYSDCFAVYGLSEYYRAAPDSALLALALDTFERIRRRIEAPDFGETAPYLLPRGRPQSRRAHDTYRGCGRAGADRWRAGDRGRRDGICRQGHEPLRPPESPLPARIPRP
ncbi:MAG: AGE family epimerase/isomerase [Acidobacteria bacterium]|nr:AGE family epimerase/isomerase [Acidobacteriota bacterium]